MIHVGFFLCMVFHVCCVSGNIYTAPVFQHDRSTKHKKLQVYFFPGNLRAYSAITAKCPDDWGDIPASV